MSSVLRSLLPLIFLATVIPAVAQRPMHDSADVAKIRAAIDEFIDNTSDSLETEHLAKYTVGRFTARMESLVGTRLFEPAMFYHIGGVQSIDPADTLAIAAVTSHGDTLPLFGPLAIEMTFFMHKSDSAGWRIAGLRRFGATEARASEIRYIDSSSAFPKSLKPIVVREVSAVLLSNAQLRENFQSKRAKFKDLASRFNGRDSLRMLGRIDRKVQQLNRVALNWGTAGQEIPKNIIDEYLASAAPAERERIRTELKHAETLRRVGRDSLAKHARRYKLNLARIDQTIELMHELRITFVNAELPWKGAVQLTVAGVHDDAIGYLYTPTGELPAISDDEYYYLESLGDNWYIFRAG